MSENWMTGEMGTLDPRTGIIVVEKPPREKRVLMESLLPKIYKNYLKMLRLTKYGNINAFSVQDIYAKIFDMEISVSSAKSLTQKLKYMYENIIEEVKALKEE